MSDLGMISETENLVCLLNICVDYFGIERIYKRDSKIGGEMHASRLHDNW